MPATTSNGGKIINHLLQRTSLKQSYYALRHGQSLANVDKIISSDPAISTVQHGLSDVGKEQARMAGETFATDYISSKQQSSQEKYKGVAIYSSDFKRAKETALIFGETLKKAQIPIYTNDIILEKRLRERYFGTLNGGPDNRYQEVWDVDVTNANHNEFGVESANSVLERTTKLICELDDQLSKDDTTTTTDYGGCWKCILVAHGDVLQIMQTGFLKHDDASKHRSLEHLETATLRELFLA